MHDAFETKNPAYEGVFLVGVTTTGIYCRPTCPARPKPEHLVFFSNADSAERAGYRACRRCRPRETLLPRPRWLTDLLAALNASPERRLTDQALRAQGLEPATVRRFFRRYFGLTFQQYGRAVRLGQALEALRSGSRLERVTSDFGYESPSGLRSALNHWLGQAPLRGRPADWVRVAWINTPLGPMVAGATDQGVCLVEFLDPRRLTRQFQQLAHRLQMPAAPGSHHHLDQLQAELAEYFAGQRTRFSVALVLRGSNFQVRVWQALTRIPFGQRRSYAQIAAAIAAPHAQRAVGTANGANRIAILVPCHRVVRTDGSLSGYGGGPWRKRRLLELEALVAGQGTLEVPATMGGSVV